MLGDDLIDARDPLLRQMIEVHEATGQSVIALIEVPHEQIGMYGCAAVSPLGRARPDRRRRSRGRAGHRTGREAGPGVAPSNLAVIGRYVLTPQVFAVLHDTQPGRGGEIQLTDALATLIDLDPAAGGGVVGVVFRGRRYDTGDKLDYLKTVVRWPRAARPGRAVQRLAQGVRRHTVASRIEPDGFSRRRRTIAAHMLEDQVRLGERHRRVGRTARRRRSRAALRSPPPPRAAGSRRRRPGSRCSDLRAQPDPVQERADLARARLTEPDRDHRLQAQAEGGRIDLGVVAPDHARVPQRRTRPRQVDGAMPTAAASALFGSAGVGSQQPDQLAVGRVESNNLRSERPSAIDRSNYDVTPHYQNLIRSYSARICRYSYLADRHRRPAVRPRNAAVRHAHRRSPARSRTTSTGSR